jgi:uncharacterized membrane protein
MGYEFSQFMMGANTLGLLLLSLFFFRFWRRTGDELFATFGWVFVLLAINQALVALFAQENEEHSMIHLVRLAAFLLLIAAIVRKNTAEGSAHKSPG